MEALPSIRDWDDVAAFLAVEKPNLLSKSVEAQAKALNVPTQEVIALWRNPDFRALVDHYTAVAVFNPQVRRKQYEVLKDISLHGEKDADKLKAFDIASRQARVKVPDRHEIDDRKTVEINIQQLPSHEGGFVPSTPFKKPEGRRAKLGEKVSQQEIEQQAGRIEGPFDTNTPTITVNTLTEDDEE
jgi:hypothetical protein